MAVESFAISLQKIGWLGFAKQLLRYVFQLLVQ